MAPTDPADLVRRLAAGDPSALDEAYRIHAPRCNAIAYRLLHDDAAAQDAIQEAFLSLWRHREGLVVRSAGISPWLAVVVRNAALGMLRSGRARAAREDRLRLTAEEAAPDPAAQAERRDEADKVRTALVQLPDELRMVIEMAYFRFMTMSQIAQAIETPLSTVKRRAQSALRQLAQLLEETAT